MYRVDIMRPTEAAERLREIIGGPPSALSIWPWHEGGTVRLIVRVAPGYNVDRGRIPDHFAGYKVTVERRTRPIARPR